MCQKNRRIILRGSYWFGFAVGEVSKLFHASTAPVCMLQTNGFFWRSCWASCCCPGWAASSDSSVVSSDRTDLFLSLILFHSLWRPGLQTVESAKLLTGYQTTKLSESFLSGRSQPPISMFLLPWNLARSRFLTCLIYTFYGWNTRVDNESNVEIYYSWLCPLPWLRT